MYMYLRMSVMEIPYRYMILSTGIRLGRSINQSAKTYPPPGKRLHNNNNNNQRTVWLVSLTSHDISP